ncbi:hypothetical protein AAEO56_06790 [Flavobacterium sp. DGU11]|uniref:Addiction module component, TIGR02574 family n=1 Tax=Flavobacterium arundinis TaxID=3139143 RepID=A0ABU9HUY0_9FLAO
MNITKEKERLKIAIDKVEDPEILDRISQILSGSERISLTDEQLAIVRESKEEYLRDPSTGMSLEDFEAHMKKKYGF